MSRTWHPTRLEERLRGSSFRLALRYVAESWHGTMVKYRTMGFFWAANEALGLQIHSIPRKTRSESWTGVPERLVLFEHIHS